MKKISTSKGTGDMAKQLKGFLAMKRGRIALFSAGWFMSAHAFAAYSIGAPTTGPFQKMGAWFQSYIDFMDGPFAVAAIVVSIILAVLAWNFLPNEGIFGKILKTVVSGVVILNIGTWVTSFT